jgi:hypothetical protein
MSSADVMWGRHSRLCVTFSGTVGASNALRIASDSVPPLAGHLPQDLWSSCNADGPAFARPVYRVGRGFSPASCGGRALQGLFRGGRSNSGLRPSSRTELQVWLDWSSFAEC